MQSFFEAISRYEGYRLAALRHVEQEVRRRSSTGEAQLAEFASRDIRLTLIDPKTVAAGWRPMEFPWVRLVEQFRPYIKRFEAAIWVDGVLQAMSYGRPSKGPTYLTMHFLERRMDNEDALKGCAALIATDAAEAYAQVLGKAYVRLKDPRPAALATYARLGFTDDGVTKGISYMKRQVTP